MKISAISNVYNKKNNKIPSFGEIYMNGKVYLGSTDEEDDPVRKRIAECRDKYNDIDCFITRKDCSGKLSSKKDNRDIYTEEFYFITRHGNQKAWLPPIFPKINRYMELITHYYNGYQHCNMIPRYYDAFYPKALEQGFKVHKKIMDQETNLRKQVSNVSAYWVHKQCKKLYDHEMYNVEDFLAHASSGGTPLIFILLMKHCCPDEEIPEFILKERAAEIAAEQAAKDKADAEGIANGTIHN